MICLMLINKYKMILITNLKTPITNNNLINMVVKFLTNNNTTKKILIKIILQLNMKNIK
jgi:hypothetical protein